MKRLFAFALAAICSGGILAADGLSETDENGLTPYVWWKFDGSNTEYGSYATEATIAGTYVISQGGFALKHTGNGWGGGIGTANNWDDWTLVVVAKATSVDNGVIFGLGNRNSNTPANTRGIALASGGTDKVTVSPFFGTSSHTDLLTADVTNASSEYHCYVVTFAGSTKTVTLYVDGENKGSGTLESEVCPVEGHWQFGSIHGGTNNTGLNEQKNQFFDDVRFYRQTLTAEQISTIAASFPAWIGTRTLAENETWALTKDESLDTLTTAGGAKIDLNGYNLTVGTATPNSFGDNGANLFLITNSNDAVLSTLTCGIGNGTLGFNKTAILGGNLKYVMTGSNQTHFRQNNETVDSAIVPNTHTGGTVLNTTKQIRFYTPDSFGSGPIVFGDGSELSKTSNNASGGTIANEIQVLATTTPATLNIDQQTYSFTGALTGSGTLKMNYGHSPTVNNYWDMSGFTGTLIWDLADKGTSWRREDINMPDGTLSLPTNAVVKLKPMSGGSQIYRNVTIAFGHLETTATDDADYLDHTTSCIQSQLNNQTITLQVGKLGKSGTYSGNIEQESDNSKIALDKIGTGTWTLDGNNLAHKSGTTVSAGRLNINTATGWTSSAITVKNGATLGGTGTVPTAVTVEAGGTIAGSLTLSGGVTFSGAGTVEVAAGESITTTSVIDASTLTVKLTGTLTEGTEYTILTAGSGSTGKATVVVDDPPENGAWRTRWDGTTLKAYYVGPGFIIRIADSKVTLDQETELTTWLTNNSVNAASATEEDYLATTNSKGISPLAAYLLGYTEYSNTTDAPTMTASVLGDSFTLAYDLTGKTTPLPTISGIGLSYAIESSSDPAFASSVTTTDGTTLAFASAGLYNRLVANIVAN